MTKILDWAETNMKPNLWALLTVTLLLRLDQPLPKIETWGQWAGTITICIIFALFVSVVVREVGKRAASLLQNQQRGFTLIEIAIVLVVIGALGGALVSIGSTSSNNVKLRVTKDKIELVQQALQGFVIENGCLPCPADPAGTTGVQAPLPTAPARCEAAACTFNAGAIPWVTLGLPEEDAADGWSRRFTYSTLDQFHVDASTIACAATYTALKRCTTSGSANFPSVADANEIVITDAAGTIIAGGDAGAPATQNKDFAYALVSHGQDGAFGRTFAGTTIANNHGQVSGDAGQGENADNDRTFAADNINTSAGTAYFDDVTVYISAPALIIACGAGSCGNP